jgi:hypothetical protein
MEKAAHQISTQGLRELRPLAAEAKSLIRVAGAAQLFPGDPLMTGMDHYADRTEGGFRSGSPERVRSTSLDGVHLRGCEIRAAGDPRNRLHMTYERSEDYPMLKVTLAALAVALLTPALAHAATPSAAHIRGAVVAKQTNRHVLVIALRHGTVMSARVSARQLHQARLGSRLALTGKRLADGSFHVTTLRRIGHTTQTRIHAVVLKAKANRLLVAGGGSAFSLRLTHRTRVLAGAGTPQAGDEVQVEIELGDDAVGTTVQSTGQAPLIDFSGVVTAIDSTSFTVSDDGISTVIQLPASDSLPGVVQVGSEVEVVASISGSTLTLTTIKLDDEGSMDNGGSSVDNQGDVKAEGFVTALGSGSITIQPGDNASPTTFAIPTGFTLPNGLAVGSVVEARGDMENSTLTLTRIELKNENGDQGELEAEGTVTAFDAGSITIQTGDAGGSGTPITLAIPDGFTLPEGLAVGSVVDAKGAMVNAVATLTEIELQNSGD